MCLGFSFFLEWKFYTFQLEEELNFNKNSLVNLLFLLKATNQEIKFIVDSCFNSKKLDELKIFVETKRRKTIHKYIKKLNFKTFKIILNYLAVLSALGFCYVVSKGIGHNPHRDLLKN